MGVEVELFFVEAFLSAGAAFRFLASAVFEAHTVVVTVLVTDTVLVSAVTVDVSN